MYINFNKCGWLATPNLDLINRFSLTSNLPGEGGSLIYVTAFYLLAGLVAGAIFAIRTLLTLAGLVLVECVGVTFTLGVSAGFWSLGGLVALQIGYLAGVYLRDVLELARVNEPGAGRSRHL
jgi:hypothetical protein